MYILLPELMDIVISYVYPPQECANLLHELQFHHEEWEDTHYWGWSFVHWYTMLREDSFDVSHFGKPRRRNLRGGLTLPIIYDREKLGYQTW